MVASNLHSISSLSELRNFVFRTMAKDHDLLLGAFPTSETVLRSANGSDCGVLFSLFGPRTVRITAIWEKKSNRVLFYGPNGSRYAQVNLIDTLPTDL